MTDSPISKADLDEASEAAYRKGAEDVCLMLGLPADRDRRYEFVMLLHESVGFMRAFREAKKVAIHAAIKWVTVAILIGLAALAGLKIAGK